MNDKYLFLIRDDAFGKTSARTLGTQLMALGHTVFLSDTDEDLEVFGEVVDAFVEIRPDGDAPQAVLYAWADHARPSRQALLEKATVLLPADDAALSVFSKNLVAAGEGRTQ